MFRRFIGAMFRSTISRLVREQLAVVENENTFLVGTRSVTGDRDRQTFTREEVLEEALESWRLNPIARRIVELTTQYVVGGGLRFSIDHEATHQFVDAMWNHPLNQLPMRAVEWCDELTRSGELFLLVSTGIDGMSFIRAVPALQVKEIVTAENDVQQELAFVVVQADELEEVVYPGLSEQWISRAPLRVAEAADAKTRSKSRDSEQNPEPANGFQTVMLHYAINRPVGAIRGESDLAPLLRWINRYSGWLEDRARLNRFRNSFLFVVKGAFTSEAERVARQNALQADPPQPGSFLVTDVSETWEVINPLLQSQDANEDGLALKKMIASGAGLPLHFLAEPEGSTRTTAESAGGPTFRRFEQRQEFFTWLVSDLLRVCIERRKLVDGRVKSDARITVRGADLSARDNASLAVSASTVISAFRELRDRGLIDDAELMRLAYRFLGEVVDLEAIMAAGKKAGMVKDLNPAPGSQDQTSKGGDPTSKQIERPVGIKIDPETGEARGAAAI